MSMTSALLGQGFASPPLDGIRPVFMPTGADPSAGAGLDLPPGSISYAGAAGYFWKFGTDPTDWTPAPFSTGGGGGIANVTGSNGIHVTGSTTKNVTNDLVTGAAVAQVDAEATGAILLHSTGGDITLDTDGAHDLLLNLSRDMVATVGRSWSVTAAGASGITLACTHATSGSIDISSAHGDINLTASDDGKILAHAASLAEITGAGVRIVSNPGSQLILGSGANTILAVGGSFSATSGGNYSFTNNAGSNGSFVVTTDGTGDFTVNSADDITLNAPNGLITLTAGTDGLAVLSPNGPINVQSGANLQFQISDGGDTLFLLQGATNAFRISYADVTTGIFSIFNAAGQAQAAAIPDASGGDVRDTESRDAINALLASMRAWGFVAT
jgi:hypothetical protein